MFGIRVIKNDDKWKRFDELRKGLIALDHQYQAAQEAVKHAENKRRTLYYGAYQDILAISVDKIMPDEVHEYLNSCGLYRTPQCVQPTDIKEAKELMSWVLNIANSTRFRRPPPPPGPPRLHHIEGDED